MGSQGTPEPNKSRGRRRELQSVKPRRSMALERPGSPARGNLWLPQLGSCLRLELIAYGQLPASMSPQRSRYTRAGRTGGMPGSPMPGARLDYIVARLPGRLAPYRPPTTIALQRLPNQMQERITLHLEYGQFARVVSQKIISSLGHEHRIPNTTATAARDRHTTVDHDGHPRLKLCFISFL